MAISGAQTGQLQDEPGTSFQSRRQVLKNDGDISKGHRSQPKVPPNSQS